MKLKTMRNIVSILLVTATIGCSSTTAKPYQNSTSSTVHTSFFCATDIKGIPTTYARTKRGRVSVIKWVSQYFKQGGYDPQTRCQQVSSQFQKLYTEGTLNYLSAGRKNNQSIICGLSTSNSNCEQLFTLKPGENAGSILQNLRKIANGNASSSPIFTAGAVDMKKFLKNAHVE